MQFSAIQSMAQSLGVEINPIGMRNVSELEQAITAFAQNPNGGLIATAVAELSKSRGYNFARGSLPVARCISVSCLRC